MKDNKLVWLCAISLLVLVSGCLGYREKQIESIETPIVTKTISTVFPTKTITVVAPIPSSTQSLTQTVPLTLISSSTLSALKTQYPSEPHLVAKFGKRNYSPRSETSILFSPDGNYLVIAEHTVKIVDVKNYQVAREFEIPYEGFDFPNMTIDSKSKFVAIVIFIHKEEKSHVLVWNMQTSELLYDWILQPAIQSEATDTYPVHLNSIVFLPNSTKLAFGNGNTVEVRDIQENSEPMVFELGENTFASQISYPNDGRFLYVFMSWDKWHTFPALYKTIFVAQIWDMNTYKLRREIKFPEIKSTTEFMSLHNSYLLTRKPYEAIYEAFNLETDEKSLLPYREGWQYLSPDGKYLFFMRYIKSEFEEDERGIEIWDSDTWRMLYLLKPAITGNDYFSLEIAISNDNNLLAVSYAGLVEVWDVSPVITE